MCSIFLKNSCSNKFLFIRKQSSKVNVIDQTLLANYGNRNPMNLEAIGYLKPTGFVKSPITRDYFKILEIFISRRHIRAQIYHHLTGIVMAEASTLEYDILAKIPTVSLVNRAAIKLVATVLALRCQQAGITNIHWPYGIDDKPSRINTFCKTLVEYGIKLEEPKRKIPLELSMAGNFVENDEISGFKYFDELLNKAIRTKKFDR